MAIDQITQFRLPNGEIIALVDWEDKPLRSTVEILDGTTALEMNLFQYVVGDSVPAFAPVAVTAQRTADESDTNLAAPGAMSSTEEFLVFALRPEVHRLAVANAAAPDFAVLPALALNGEPIPTPVMLDVLALRLLMTLEISEKLYTQAGFGYYNFGAGLYAVTADAATVSIGQKGLPTHEAIQSFSIPQHIGGQEKFRVVLQNPAGAGIEVGHGDGGNDDADQATRFARIRIYMDGLYKRPVS